MFGFGGRSKALQRAVDDGAELIRSIRQTCAHFDVDDDQFLSDPYLFAYVAGAFSILYSPAYGRRFTSDEAGIAANGAWQANGVDPAWASQRMTKIARSDEQDIQRGLEHGARFALLRINKLNPTCYDADVNAAISDAGIAQLDLRTFGVNQSLNLAEAAAAVLHLRYLEGHLQNGRP